MRGQYKENVGECGQTHRSSCHRCGNIRKSNVLCTRCPQTYCYNCSLKMITEHGENVFDNGCPVCLLLCCCGEKSDNESCTHLFHCYKKCPTTKASRRFHKENKGCVGRSKSKKASQTFNVDGQLPSSESAEDTYTDMSGVSPRSQSSRNDPFQIISPDGTTREEYPDFLLHSSDWTAADFNSSSAVYSQNDGCEDLNESYADYIDRSQSLGSISTGLKLEKGHLVAPRVARRTKSLDSMCDHQSGAMHLNTTGGDLPGQAHKRKRSYGKVSTLKFSDPLHHLAQSGNTLHSSPVKQETIHPDYAPLLTPSSQPPQQQQQLLSQDALFDDILSPQSLTLETNPFFMQSAISRTLYPLQSIQPLIEMSSEYYSSQYQPFESKSFVLPVAVDATHMHEQSHSPAKQSPRSRLVAERTTSQNSSHYSGQTSSTMDHAAANYWDMLDNMHHERHHANGGGGLDGSPRGCGFGGPHRLPSSTSLYSLDREGVLFNTPQYAGGDVDLNGETGLTPLLTDTLNPVSQFTQGPSVGTVGDCRSMYEKNNQTIYGLGLGGPHESFTQHHQHHQDQDQQYFTTPSGQQLQDHALSADRTGWTDLSFGFGLGLFSPHTADTTAQTTSHLTTPPDPRPSILTPVSAARHTGNNGGSGVTYTQQQNQYGFGSGGAGDACSPMDLETYTLFSSLFSDMRSDASEAGDVLSPLPFPEDRSSSSGDQTGTYSTAAGEGQSSNGGECDLRTPSTAARTLDATSSVDSCTSSAMNAESVRSVPSVTSSSGLLDDLQLSQEMRVSSQLLTSALQLEAFDE